MLFRFTEPGAGDQWLRGRCAGNRFTPGVGSSRGAVLPLPLSSGVFMMGMLLSLVGSAMAMVGMSKGCEIDPLSAPILIDGTLTLAADRDCVGLTSATEIEGMSITAGWGCALDRSWPRGPDDAPRW